MRAIALRPRARPAVASAAMAPVSPIRACLARVGEVLRDELRAPLRRRVEAVAALTRDEASARWYAHLCTALLRWNDGALHDGLAAVLDDWERCDLTAHRALQVAAERSAQGDRIAFARFDLDRVVLVARQTRGGARARVFDDGVCVAEGDAIEGLVALGELAFLVRRGRRWRAVYGATRSRSFDRVEHGAMHGDRPLYLVRDGTRRRVIVGATDGRSWARVKLPAWGGTMLEAAPEFFVPYADPGPVVYAARGPRTWAIVRDGVREKTVWDAIEDLAVVDGEACYRAARAGRWRVVAGARRSPPCDEIPRVSWPGGRAVYRARHGARWTVVDGDRTPLAYDALSRVELRRGEVFYAGRDGALWWVHRGEARWGPYRGVELLPPPAAESEGDATSGAAAVAYCAALADGAGEAVFVDGVAVARFESIAAAHFTAAGVVCAGRRGGRVAVCDVDGRALASVEDLAPLGGARGDAHFERVAGQTWFVSRAGRQQRLHVGAWCSPPFDRVVPLYLTRDGDPVYGARDGGGWSLRAGARSQPIPRRPTAAWWPEDAPADRAASLRVTLAGGRAIEMVW